MTSPTFRLSAIAVASVVVLAASLLIGARPIAPADVLAALAAGPASTGTDTAHIVWALRLPRTVLALAVGASLAVAGALTQAWTNNPLADPGFIGVTAGAGLGVAAGTLFGLSTSTSLLVCALGGATAAVVLVFAVARRAASPLTVLLVGAGVTASAQAITTALALNSGDVLDGMRQWTVGSTLGRGGEDIAVAGVGLALGLVLAGLVARPLDIVSMSPGSARSLGVSVARTSVITAGAIVVLAATATAAVGPVAFVGFAAPHLLRPVVGSTLTRLLPAVAVAGGLLVVAADTLGRVVGGSGEVEMSIILAILGAPLLVASLAKRRQAVIS